MPPKERTKAARHKIRADGEKCLESEYLPKEMPNVLDKEENKERLLAGGHGDEAADFISCGPVSEIEERDEEVPDEEESGAVLVVMKWKTPSEKERSRQGRKRQLEEYHKREAVFARQERYRKRCRWMEACDSSAVEGVTLPQQPLVSVDTSPRKQVKWKRDDSLVVVHEMPAEDVSKDCSELCENPSNSVPRSTPS